MDWTSIRGPSPDMDDGPRLQLVAVFWRMRNLRALTLTCGPRLENRSDLPWRHGSADQNPYLIDAPTKEEPSIVF